MPCFHPMAAARVGDGVRFLKKASDTWRGLSLPCGQCIGCRLEKSRQWAVRIMHEAACHDENSFLTLTFDDEHLPHDWSLDKRTFQLFMKRLRKAIEPVKVRHFYCGEYGERFGRPHYHVCLFGYGFPDKRFHTMRGSFPVWRSDLLEAVWSGGLAEIGSLTFESAAYVSRYVASVVTGEKAEKHYTLVDDKTGEMFRRKAEFADMSRRPGIGREWFERFRSDTYPSDSVVVRGVECKPPRYYDKMMAELNPGMFEAVCSERERKIRWEEQNAIRREAAATVALAAFNLRRRGDASS